jgi:hypothetical protein
MPRPSRTQKPKRSIKDLPDFAILNDAETCEVLNISPDTRRRLRDSGELPHVQVSDGRIGVSRTHQPKSKPGRLLCAAQS